LKLISHTKTFLFSFGTSEQILFEIFSGNIGTTVFGKYIDVPLLKASLSISEFLLTTSATSAIATQRLKPSIFFSHKTASSKSFASFHLWLQMAY
jgi:hypothetical protein